LIHVGLEDKEKFLCGNPKPVLIKMASSGAKT
jgi:hypothetical protein